MTDIIQNALNVVLGASSGQISQNNVYALVATDLGALLRIDVDVYSFEVQSQGLQNHAKNMTAITSIVSTINPNALTLSDLRGVVSLSYGNSDDAKQKEIFELVRSAWENDRKMAIGQTLALSDHQSYQSLLKPSDYERQMRTRNATAGLASLNLNSAPPAKVDAGTLKSALSDFKRTNTASPASTSAAPLGQNAPAAVNGSDTTKPASALGSGANGTTSASTTNDMADVFLWVELLDQATEEWLRYMEGALSGFNERETFAYDSISGGRSGNALAFKCKVHANPKMFDLGLAYIRDTLIPKIRKAEYLSINISHMALQYNHPSKDGSGMITVVTYLQNDIVNNTKDIITFYSEEDSVILTLQPGATGMLDGQVTSITTALVVAGAAAGDTPAPAPSPAQSGDAATSPGKRYVTYDDVLEERITTGVKMWLSGGPKTGYALSFYFDHNVAYTINYSSEWSSE